MNLLSCLTKTYSVLFDKPYLPMVMKVCREIVRITTEVHIQKYKNIRFVPWGRTAKNLYISFTSFPARINDVWKVVVSLKNQTIVPEKIILWLSKDQFPSKNSIPRDLWNQVGDLFEIQMVDGDIRSHKKYYYMLLQHPEKSFITCDDDVIYDSGMVERLLECAKNNQGCVIANQTWKIEWDNEGNAFGCGTWKSGIPYEKTDLMQIGIGGVLYPPHCLHELVTKTEIFMSATPMADDIWLNCMARLNNTNVVQTKEFLLKLPIKNGSPNLCDENDGQNRNMLQLEKLRKYLRENNIKDVYQIQRVLPMQK